MSEGYVPGSGSIPFSDELESFEFDITTERIYANLPEVFRLVDELQQIPSSGQPLKRYIRGIAGVHDDIEVLIARINYLDPSERIPGLISQDWTQYSRRTEPEGAAPIGTTSDLVDPISADDGWLDWLAQLVGVNLENLIGEQERRDAVQSASSGFRAGSKTAIADAARSALTGSKYVVVYDHSTDDVGGIGTGTQWDVLLITKSTETPDLPAVLEAINRKGAKPAGVILHHRAFEATWDAIEAAFPTWDDIEAAGSWNAIEEVGF